MPKAEYAGITSGIEAALNQHPELYGLTEEVVGVRDPGARLAEAIVRAEMMDPNFIEKAHARLRVSLNREKTNQVGAFVGVLHSRIKSLTEPQI